jgi:hypothetical protein
LEIHGINTGTTDYNLIASGHGSSTTFVVKGTSSVGLGITNPPSSLSVLGSFSFGAYSNITAPANGFIGSGSIGIGTNTPQALLDVNGSMNINYAGGTNGSQLLRLSPNTSNGETSIAFFQNPLNSGSVWRMGTNTGGASNSFGIYSSAISTNAVTINIDGNIGIGTTNPSSKLAVNGSVAIGSYSGILAPSNGLIVNGNVGIGTTIPLANLHLQGSLRAPSTIETGPYVSFDGFKELPQIFVKAGGKEIPYIMVFQ